jgi:hypothetical protein
MGGPGKIRKQHDQGKLTARERIDRLLDPDSFLEIGILNHSDVPGMEDKTPADSKVAGYGRTQAGGGQGYELYKRPGAAERSQNLDYCEKNLRNGLLEYVRHGLRHRFSGGMAVSGNELCRSGHRGQCGLRRQTVGIRQEI